VFFKLCLIPCSCNILYPLIICENYLKTNKGYLFKFAESSIYKKGSVITDIKDLQLLKSYHQKIELNAFDEKDIYSFLNLIKKFAEKNAPILELSDFIAQREKHRGHIHTYLLDAKVKVDKSVKGKTALIMEPVYSFEQIANNINDIMVLHKLSGFKDEAICGIILFIISLLHDVEIINKKDHIGKLVFSIVSDQIVLSAVIHGKNKTDVTFPLIQVKNIFCKLGHQTSEPILFIDGVKIKNVTNKLVVNFN